MKVEDYIVDLIEKRSNGITKYQIDRRLRICSFHKYCVTLTEILDELERKDTITSIHDQDGNKLYYRSNTLN